jgi:hypothetical protein
VSLPLSQIANAGGYDGHYGHGNYGHHSGYYGYGHRPYYGGSHYNRYPGYSGYASHRNYTGYASNNYISRQPNGCRQVYKNAYDDYGNPQQIGGTMCYDNYGQGYVVEGSRYQIR